jgi:hypothetical protein
MNILADNIVTLSIKSSVIERYQLYGELLYDIYNTIVT